MSRTHFLTDGGKFNPTHDEKQSEPNSIEAKLSNAQGIMKDLDIPLWMVYSKHKSDKTFHKLIGPESPLGILFLTPNEKRVIVTNLDKDNFAKYELGDDLLIYDRNLKDIITDVLKDFKFDGRIALNYSKRYSDVTDRLGAGTRDYMDNLLIERFPKIVSKENIRDHAFSGEDILLALYDRKSDEEISKMSLAANRALSILEKTFKNIRPGMSDYEAFELVQKIASKPLPKRLKNKGVVKQEFSWESEYCPIVLTGEGFTKGAHTPYCGDIIEPGNTLYFDFGVKLHFGDGTYFSSDIQRMGYVLKNGESVPSSHAQNIFDILYFSVSKGIEALGPDVTGAQVDKIVRDIINNEGHDYNHSTGHPIGEEAHNPGTTISAAKNVDAVAHLKIQPTGVYTIEPRIPIVNGGSIEEMVYVNPKGKNFTLCPRQKELYLISNK